MKDERRGQPGRQTIKDRDELFVFDNDELWIEGTDDVLEFGGYRLDVVQREPVEPGLPCDVMPQVLLKPGFIRWFRGWTGIDEVHVHPFRRMPHDRRATGAQYFDPVSPGQGLEEHVLTARAAPRRVRGCLVAQDQHSQGSRRAEPGATRRSILSSFFRHRLDSTGSAPLFRVPIRLDVPLFPVYRRCRRD